MDVNIGKRLGRRAGLVMGLAAFAGAAQAGEPAPRPGAYEVKVRLELPHLENHDVKTTTVCLAAGEDRAFPVLSDNNPLGRCRARNLRRTGGEIAFDIVCPGGGAAKAQAIFSASENAFQGRIAMTMGGKNMTMTEVQQGRRIGECDAAAR